MVKRQEDGEDVRGQRRGDIGHEEVRVWARDEISSEAVRGWCRSGGEEVRVGMKKQEDGEETIKLVKR
jgi:hypothetical protein